MRPATPAEALLAQQNQALFSENQARSQNEQALYNAWLNEKQEREKLQTIVHQLQMQMQILQKTVNDKNTTENIQSKNTQTCEEYHTDEEELSRETEWVRVRNSKKRKASTSPCEKLQTTSRKLQPQQNVQDKRKPPPVIINKIDNYENLIGDLVNKGAEFQTTMIAGGNIKINADNANDYRSITNTVKDMGLEWYSFEDKQTRPIRVVVKNLHHSCKPEHITADLKSKGFKILDVYQILKRKDKTPLPIFVLTFSKEEDVKKIYEIQYILRMKVAIEAFKKPKLIPQCKNCQEYGHTQKYCGREARCVKCAGKHHTTECRKPQNAQPKCIHCGEAHPASYRGCRTAITLQELRNKSTNRKLPVNPSSEKTSARRITQRQVEDGVSYAQVAQPTNEPQQSAVANTDTITLMLQKMLKQMELQEKKQEEFNKSILDRLTKLENHHNRRNNLNA